MKTLILIFSFLHSILFSQSIMELSATQNGLNQIKVHLKTYFPTSESAYLSYTADVNQNIITLNPCFYMSPLGGPAQTTFYENDFYLDIADSISYTLNINLYISTNNTVCNHNRIEDTATLNFSTPIQGTVSLAVNENVLDKQRVDLFPVPAKDELNIRTSEKIEKIKVYDATGKLLPISLINNKINTAQLKKGTYFLEIFTGKKIVQRKFVVEK